MHIIKSLNLSTNKLETKKFSRHILINLDLGGFEKTPDLVNLFRVNEKQILFSGYTKKLYCLDSFIYQNYIKNHNILVPRILIDLGFFVKRGVFSTKTEKTHFSNLCFGLTTDCNLSCKYCFANAGKYKHKIPFDLAKKAIDFVANHSKRKFTLKFLPGGEPTLDFNLLKRVISYYKKKCSGPFIFLSTNGVISKPTLDYLIENIDVLQISCDGPPSIQDKQRPLKNGGSSSPFVEETIKYLVRKKKKFVIKIVVSTSTLGKEEALLAYFNNLGVKKIGFAPLQERGRAKENNIVPMNHKEYGKFLIKIIELGSELGIEIENILFGVLGRRKPVTCGAGFGTFTIDSEGRVNACIGYSGKSDLMIPEFKELLFAKYDFKKDKFIIDWNKINLLKKSFFNKRCRKCKYFYFCYAKCPLDNFRENKDFSIPASKSCDFFERQLNNFFRYIVRKDFIRIKPFIKERDSSTYFSLISNEFELSKTENNEKLNKNPFIQIEPSKTDFKELTNAITRHRNNYKGKIRVFLLSFTFSKKDLNLRTGKKIALFVSSLNKNNIYFRITKPLPRCLFGSGYDKLIEKYKIPTNCKECLELFTVKDDDSITFCNEQKGKKKINEYKDRNEIFKEFRNNLQFSDKCNSMMIKALITKK